MLRQNLAAAWISIFAAWTLAEEPSSALCAAAAAAEDPLYMSRLTGEQADADAVILLETESLHIEKPDRSTYEYRIVKKILRTRRSGEGVYSFPDNRFMKIETIRAKAVHPGGEEENLTEKDFPKIPDFQDFVMYSDQTSRHAGFEGTRRGTIVDITVRWRISSPVHWPSARFAADVPILSKSFTLKHGSEYPVRVTALNIEERPDSISEEDGVRTLVWTRSDIERLEEEEMMPPAGQYIPMIMVAPGSSVEHGARLDFSSWQGIADWYTGLSRDSLKPGSGTRRILQDLDLDLSDGKATARKIYCHISRRVRYVAIYLGLGGFRPHKADETARKLYGDCKDQSTLLTVLLRESGLEAHPVLVRTARLGRLEGIAPYPGYFNHVITCAVIEGDTVYLDPTCGICSFGSLPSAIQGSHALHTGGEGVRLIVLPEESGPGNRRCITSRMKIDGTSDVRVSENHTCSGSYAEAYRSIFSNDPGDPEETIARRMLSRDHPFIDIADVEISGKLPSSPSIRIDIDYSIPGMVKDRSRVFLDAILHRLPIGTVNAEERIFPVDLGARRADIYRTEIELPPGIRIETLPDPLEISNEYFDYSGTWNRTGSGVVFERSFRLDDRIVPAERTPEIMECMEKIASFENSKLLLVRDGTQP